MKIIINNKVYSNECKEFRHYDDLLKLQRLMEELGFPKIDLEDLRNMWDEISDKYYAGWLVVPSLAENLIPYLEELKVGN